MNNELYVVLLIITILMFCIYKKCRSGREHLSYENMADTATTTPSASTTTSGASGANLEAINNLSSILNTGNLTATNIKATGTLNVGDKFMLKPDADNWLRLKNPSGAEFGGFAATGGLWTNSGLYVGGDSTMVGNLNNITFAPSWGAWPAGAIDRSKQAGISNDFGNYKTLMLVGNNSAGAERRVGIWDSLTVNGNQNVTGNSSIGGGQTVGGSQVINGDLTVNGKIRMGPYRIQFGGAAGNYLHIYTEGYGNSSPSKAFIIANDGNFQALGISGGWKG